MTYIAAWRFEVTQEFDVTGSRSPSPRIAIAMRHLDAHTGASRNVQEQCRWFGSLGFDIDVYAERVSAGYDSHARVHRLRRWPLPRSLRRIVFDWRVQRRIRRFPNTTLISHGDVQTPDILFMHNCRHLAHELVTGNSLPSSDPIGIVHRRAITAPGLQLLIANSQLMADDFVSRFGLSTDRIRVLYQGYPPSIFSTKDHERLRVLGRERIGLSPDVPLAGLITSGDFAKRNVDGLLHAAARAGGYIQWLVVGKDRHIAHYQKAATELGIGRRVHFQPITREVELLYHALDVFVLPAHIEEFGRSALEAMACGTPVILGPRIGCSELLVGTTRRGRLADLDPDGIARVVDNLMGDTEARAGHGEACASIARGHIDARQSARLLEILHTHLPTRFPRIVR